MFEEMCERAPTKCLVLKDGVLKLAGSKVVCC